MEECLYPQYHHSMNCVQVAELSDEQLRGLASVASSYVMSGKTLGLGTGASLPFKV